MENRKAGAFSRFSVMVKTASTGQNAGPAAAEALAAFFALIFSHFSADVIFFLLSLFTPLSMLFDMVTSTVRGE